MAKNRPFTPGDVVYFPETNSCAILMCTEGDLFTGMQNISLATGELVDFGGNMKVQHATPTQKKIYFQHLTKIFKGHMQEQAEKTIIDVAKEAINSKNNKK